MKCTCLITTKLLVWYLLLLVWNYIMKLYNKHTNCKSCSNFSMDHQNFLADHWLAIAVIDHKNVKYSWSLDTRNPFMVLRLITNDEFPFEYSMNWFYKQIWIWLLHLFQQIYLSHCPFYLKLISLQFFTPRYLNSKCDITLYYIQGAGHSAI
jgi:hypothetical protein